MKKFLKSSLSVILAITIIFSSAIVGFSEVNFSNVFMVKSKAASDDVLSFYEDSYFISGDLAYGERYFYLAVGSCDPYATGNVVIPSTYNGWTVEGIGDFVFYSRYGITSITIPRTITIIGEYNFFDCDNLKYIFYEGSEQEWQNISFESYPNCVIHYNSTDHTYSSEWTVVEPTCTKDGSISHNCLVCDAPKDITVIEATGHNYGDYSVLNEPNCVKEGLQQKTCSTCGDVATESINALGHDFSRKWTVDKEPTCTENGLKSHHCTRCDIKADDTSIPAVGHTAGEWVVVKEPTCTHKGEEIIGCETCGEVLDSKTIFELPHKTYWEIVKESTCVETGIRIKKCETCENQLEIETTLANGHSYSTEWTIDKAATCKEAGSKSRHCTICDDKVDVMVIPSDSTQHSYSDWLIEKAATCETIGRRVRICNDCGDTEYEIIPVTEHTSSDWFIDNNATVNAPGKKHKECTECGEVLETAVIPQLKPATPKLSKIANTASGVTFTWGAVDGADSYMVYRRAYNSKTKAWSGWVRIADGVTSTSYLDKTAKSGYYRYTVRAVNEAGNSGYDANGLKTYFLSTPKATTANSNSGVTVKWGKVSGATGYIVYRKTGNGKWQNLGKTTSTSFTDKTAKAGVTYKYTVKAYYGSYVSAYNTNGYAVRRLLTPTLKSVTSAKAGVTFKWNKVTGATGYIVYRKTGNGSWQNLGKTTGVSFTDKTAKKGVTYTYTVKAYYGTSNSAYNTKGLTIKDKY